MKKAKKKRDVQQKKREIGREREKNFTINENITMEVNFPEVLCPLKGQ